MINELIIQREAIVIRLYIKFGLQDKLKERIKPNIQLRLWN